MVDVCEYKVRMIYHPAVPLGDGGFVISLFYFFRQEDFIIKSLVIGFFGIELVGKMRSYQTKADILLRVLFLQFSDSFGTHLVKPAHSSVQEHCPAFGFYELFQCFFDLLSLSRFVLFNLCLGYFLCHCIYKSSKSYSFIECGVPLVGQPD